MKALGLIDCVALVTCSHAIVAKVIWQISVVEIDTGLSSACARLSSIMANNIWRAPNLLKGPG